jgi:hypothetical protein
MAWREEPLRSLSCELSGRSHLDGEERGKGGGETTPTKETVLECRMVPGVVIPW